MDEMGISEKELKLLMNFIKDDLMEAKNPLMQHRKIKRLSGFSNISSSISKTKCKQSRRFPGSVILTERRSCHRLSLLCNKKPFCQLLSVIYKHLCHLIALSLFISARADFSFIKRKDFRPRDPQQDRRVRRDNKL